MLNTLKLIKLFLNTKYQNDAGRFLIENNKTLSIAESCTGGLLSSLMTDVSGSSAYIKCNFVTYANEAKMQYLGVKKQTLENYGAVSLQTAEEMVKGLLERTGCDYALATTGIAGPTGGTEEKPVGLVYIGIGTKDKFHVFKYNTNPNYPRLLIKYMFANQALRLFSKFITERD